MLALRIALRYLLARKSHSAVNIITAIAISGVAIATMAMLLVLSIFNGFSDLAESQLSRFDPPLAIKPTTAHYIANADSLAARLERSIPEITHALPTLSDRALLVSGSHQVPVTFKGVPSGYDKATTIEETLLDGIYAEWTTTELPAMIISVGVANEIRRIPSPVSLMQIYVPRRTGRINPANPMASFRGSEVVVCGVFRVDNSDIDNDHVILPLDVARDLLACEAGEATTIELQLAPGADVETVKGKVQQIMGTSSFSVQTRMEQRAEAFRMISVEKWITFMMLIFILVIALFNVVSTLSLMAIEKRDNMNTLRYLGAPKRMVKNVFIAEGFLVTTTGGIIGIILGLILALLQQYCHIVGLSADASTLTIDYYPVRVAISDVAIVLALTLAVALTVGGIARIVTRNRHKPQ